MNNPLIDYIHYVPEDQMIIPEVEYIVTPVAPQNDEIIDTKVEEVIAVAEE